MTVFRKAGDLATKGWQYKKTETEILPADNLTTNFVNAQS